MSNRFLTYLEHEHQRLERAVADEYRKLLPDTVKLARLKKTKLAIKDQISAWRTDLGTLAAH